MSLVVEFKPYLYIEELAARTPWSVEAIRKMVQRRELKRGTHFVQEHARARLIFKWAAIVDLIESLGSDRLDGRAEDAARRPPQVIDVEEATERLRRLHR